MAEKCEMCGECECNCEESKGKNIKLYFCPRCKSKDVGFIFKLGNVFGLLPKMRCNKCGFEAVGGFPILIVSESKLNKSKSKAKRKKK